MTIIRQLAAALFAGSIVSLIPISSPVHASTPTEAWAFCGVHPDAANAEVAVVTLAAAHIDATFGPCLSPDRSSYTPANPGRRYADPATYRRLVDLNASVGMRTVVYDARIWSDNLGSRQNALVFWKDRLPWIVAWDMGDEFDPASTDWATLIARIATVAAVNTPWTGIKPYTNHLPFSKVLDQALVDFGSSSLSFDSYGHDEALALTTEFAPQTSNLMVAISALDYGAGSPNPQTIVEMMRSLRDAGADEFLIFGGAYPYNVDLTADPAFGGHSLIDTEGHATSWAEAVLIGSSD